MRRSFHLPENKIIKGSFYLSQTKKNIGQTAGGGFKGAVSCFEGVHLAAMGFGNHFILKLYVNRLIEYTSYIYFENVIEVIVKNDGLMLCCVRLGTKALCHQQRRISGNIMINKISAGIWREL